MEGTLPVVLPEQAVAAQATRASAVTRLLRVRMAEISLSSSETNSAGDDNDVGEPAPDPHVYAAAS
jgi:hypothetical protein